MADANDDGAAPGSTPHSAPQHRPQPLTRENSVNSPRNTTSPQRHHLIHGLPPKPVVANVPFLHPSHPSLIEATAMSRSTAKTKTSSGNNGFAPKPASSVDAKDLPLDWQIRNSHNGDMYYYNTKTHVSTWERPVRNGLQDDKISQPLHFPTSSSSGPKDLSYEDRHYRPGENGAPPADSRPPVLPPSNRNGTTDTWFGSAVAPSYDSRTPPDSPQHRDRSRSPLPMPQRGRRRRHPNYDGEAVDSRGDSRRPMTPPRRTETDALQESRRQHRVHDYELPQVQSKFPMEREKLPARQEPSSRNSRGHPREREPRDSQPQNTTSRHRSPPPSSFEPPPSSQRSSKRDRPSRFGGPVEATPGLMSHPPPRIADPPELVPFSNGPKGPPRHSSAPRSTSSPPATEQPSSAARRRPPLPPQEMSFRETSTKAKVPLPPASAPPTTNELPQLSTWVDKNSSLPPSGPRAAKRNRQVSTSGDVFDDLASTSPSSRAHPLPANGYGRESRDIPVENPGNLLPKGPRALRPPTSDSAPPPNQGWTRERSPPSTFGAEGHMRGFEDQGRGSMYPHPMERGQGRPPRGRGEFSRPTLSGTNSLPLGSRKTLGGPPPSSSGGDAPLSSGKFSDSRPPDGGPPTRKPRNSLGPPDSRMHMESEANPRHRMSDNGYPHRMRKEEPRMSPQEPPPNFQRYVQEHPPPSERRGRIPTPPPRVYNRRDSFSPSPGAEHRPTTPPPLSREPSLPQSWEGSRGSVRYEKERESGRRERFRDRDDRVPPPPAPHVEEPARNGMERERERERPVSPSTSRLPPGHGLPNKPEGLPPRPRRDDMDIDDGRYRRDGFEERPPLRRGGTGTLLSRLGGGGVIETGMKRDRDELGDPADDDSKKRRRSHKSRRGGNGGGKMRV